MRRLAVALAALFISAVPASALMRADVAVFGAGTSGMAAAIQAARMGSSVVVIEESGRVGGQITASAVATMDDVGTTRHGIYLEFIERVRGYYARTGTNTAICLWGSDTIAAEPVAAERILLEMLAEASPSARVLLRYDIVRAVMDGDRLISVEIDGPDGGETVEAGAFIDATETGELIAACGAEHRLGGGTSESVIQDITYPAVVRRYPEGLPADLVMPGPPPDYQRWAERFRAVVTRDGSRWPGRAPFDIPSHNAYRALPNADDPAHIDGGDAQTWGAISRTCINWANDWPAHGPDSRGLASSFISDIEERRAGERAAMHATLCFIWYMQHELGMRDWSVDSSQGYGDWWSNCWQTADDPLLPSEFAPILKHFPPRSYIREARRIVGEVTLTARDIYRDPERGISARRYRSSIALGEYPVDIHGDRRDATLEHDLGESAADLPDGWHGSLGPFQLPMEVLIPIRADGLVAAEKNISVSRIVNGAIRLHPITMHTGQAAGTIASLSASFGVCPRDVPASAVQHVLMASGAQIAADIFDDVPPGSAWSHGVQWASLADAFAPRPVGMTKRLFGAILPIRGSELAGACEAARRESGDARFDALARIASRKDFISRGELADAVSELFGRDADIKGDAELALSRGEASQIIYGLMFLKQQ